MKREDWLAREIEEAKRRPPSFSEIRASKFWQETRFLDQYGSGYHMQCRALDDAGEPCKWNQRLLRHIPKRNP